MDLKSYGISKLEYKRSLGGSINRIIEYKSKDDIFINLKSDNEYGIVRITDIVDENYLSINDIEYLVDDNKILSVGIISSTGVCNSIRFYIVNKKLDIEDIVSSIECAICMKLNSLK